MNQISKSANRSVWLAAITVIICSVWLTACTPSILASKDSKGKNPGSAGISDPAGPTKTKTAEDRALGSVAKRDSGGTSGAASGKSSDALAAPAKEATSKKKDTDTSSRNDRGNEKQPSGQSASEGQKSGASVRTTIVDIKGDRPTSGKPDSDSSAKDDAPFKRHDHKKYMQKIRNKAIDTLNKEKDTTYARVCKDSTTDEWSLWIYKLEGKTYGFVTYAWDEVDEKWEKSIPPVKKSIAGWQHHLKFTADGKQCIELMNKRR